MTLNSSCPSKKYRCELLKKIEGLQIQSIIRSMSLLKSAQDVSNTINIFFFISFMFILSVSKTTTYLHFFLKTDL